MSSENECTRKFGHRATSKMEALRVFKSASTLLTVNNATPAPSVNLVINNPLFLIGGDQQPYDQGNLGSCTANALAFAAVFNLVKQNLTTFMPSRLDIYYQERFHFGGKNELPLDEGANISDCEYVLENVGIVPEAIWKYVDNSANQLYFTMPSIVKSNPRTLALNNNTMYKVDQTNLNQIKLVLTSGYPLICGMIVDPTVFCSNSVACTGIVSKIPNLNTKGLAGHAVVIVGYTQDGYFLVRNSWGVNWGLGFLNQNTGAYNYDEYGGKMRGYFKIPFAYVTARGIVSELYAVTTMGDPTNTLKNTAHHIAPTNDSSFVEEIPIRPLATLYKSITSDQLKLKINLSYYKNDGKYLWLVSVFKLSPSLVYQLYGELSLTNMNYFDNNISFNLIQKSSTVANINIYHNNATVSIISINLASAKMSLVASYKL